MTKNKITVAGALEKIDHQESLENYIVDFTDTQLEALDVMKLTKEGITVSEGMDLKVLLEGVTKRI